MEDHSDRRQRRSRGKAASGRKTGRGRGVLLFFLLLLFAAAGVLLYLNRAAVSNFFRHRIHGGKKTESTAAATQGSPFEGNVIYPDTQESGVPVGAEPWDGDSGEAQSGIVPAHPEEAMEILESIAAPGSGSAEGAVHGGNGEKIGLLFPADTAYWKENAGHLLELLQEYGYAPELRYAAAEKQAETLRELMTEDCRLLVLAPAEPRSTALSQAVTEAHAQDIPVISFGRLLQDTEGVTAYVAADPYAVGRMQTEALCAALGLPELETGGPSGSMHDSTSGAGGTAVAVVDGTERRACTIEIFNGDPEDPVIFYQVPGMMEALFPYLDSGLIKVPSGETEIEQTAIFDWSDAEAEDRMQALLRQHYPDGEPLDGVLCGNASIARGVRQALQKAGRSGTVVVASDLGPELPEDAQRLYHRPQC